jgi:hypothetical protein
MCSLFKYKNVDRNADLMVAEMAGQLQEVDVEEGVRARMTGSTLSAVPLEGLPRQLHQCFNVALKERAGKQVVLFFVCACVRIAGAKHVSSEWFSYSRDIL